MPPKRYKVKFEKDAKNDYDREYSWSKRNWGVKHAQEFFQKLDTTIQNLSENPHLFRAHKTADELKYHVVKFKGINIAYDINDDDKIITILGFIGKNRVQDLEEILSGRITLN